MFGLNKKFWLMWANDDGHSPPIEVEAKNPEQAAKNFFEQWPGFDGQFWIFAGKPVYHMDTSTPKRGHVFSGLASGGKIMRSLRARRRAR